jgi:hypothetical protein
MELGKKSALKWTAAAAVGWSLLTYLQTQLHVTKETFYIQSGAFWTNFLLFLPTAIACVGLTSGAMGKWYPIIRRWQKDKLRRLENESAKRRQRSIQDHPGDR